MTDAVATVQNSGQQQLANVTEGSGFYSSLAMNTSAEKLAVLRAVNNSTPLLDAVGTQIAIKDVVLQTATFVNEETGAIEDAVRATLIDPDGNAFHAASKGVALSLRQAFNILGQPGTWEEPLLVTVREGRVGKNRFLTLDF
jgi:hypothetical protein